MLIFNQFNEAIKGLFRKPNPEEDHTYLLEIKRLNENVAQITRHFDALSERTTSLMTHVSIMIGVVAFILSASYPSGAEIDWIAYVLRAELIAYSLLTIPALSMAFITNSRTTIRYGEVDRSDTDALLNVYLRIYGERRRSFYLCFAALYLLSSVFALTVAVKFLS